MSLKNIGLFLICVLITLGAGGAGGIATASEIGNWYVTLIKPSFNPPNYLFGTVWTSLYFLMAFALYVILKLPKSPQRSRMLVLFVLQISLNIAWSFIFFKFHQIGWAAVEMAVLWLSILSMIIGLFRFNKTVAMLQIPYLLWVSFAFILNCTLFYLN